MLWPWCMSKWNGFSDCICLIRCMCGTVPFPGVAKSGALQVPEEGSDRDTESEGTHHRHMPGAGKTSGVEWRAYFLERLVWLEGAPVSVPWLSPPYRFWASETLCKALWTLFPVTSTHLGHHGWVVSCNENCAATFLCQILQTSTSCEIELMSISQHFLWSDVVEGHHESLTSLSWILVHNSKKMFLRTHRHVKFWRIHFRAIPTQLPHNKAKWARLRRKFATSITRRTINVLFPLRVSPI